MRINIALPYAGLAGGVRVVAQYAKYLAQNGHTVHLVSQPSYKPSVKRRVMSMCGRRDRSTESKIAKQMRGHTDGLGVSHTVLEKWRPIKASDLPEADVLLATWWETARWINDIPASRGRKVYFIQHDERVMVSARKRRGVERTWRYKMPKAVVSEWLMRMLREHGVSGHISVVPNGVDLTQFSCVPRKRQNRATIGFMYSPQKFKGCDIIYKTVQRIRSELPELRVIAFGACDAHRSCPLPPGTEFNVRPTSSELAALYSKCDVWLWASRYEGYGLPILEALACGTPVVATAAGAAPELLSHGCGAVVEIDDVIGMAAKAIRMLHASNDRWRHLSATARSVAAQHDVRMAASRFRVFLEEIGKSKRRHEIC